jgi:hypothetical protein
MAAMLKKLLSVFAARCADFCELRARAGTCAKITRTPMWCKRVTRLWDISARFLKQPWLWPEIWQANPQIENPHLIYPGDVISLAYLNGRPRLTVDGERSAEIRRGTSEAIPTIPLSDVEAFLRSRRVLDEEPRDLPYVLAIEENRLRGASGQVVYVRGANFEPGQRWAIARPSVMFAKVTHPVIGSPRRIGEAWNRDKGTQFHSTKNAWAYYVMPEKHFDTLGWEMADIATGQITVGGDPATLLIDDEGIEIKQGDVLMPILSPAYDLHFIPHMRRRPYRRICVFWRSPIIIVLVDRVMSSPFRRACEKAWRTVRSTRCGAKVKWSAMTSPIAPDWVRPTTR